MRLDQTAETTLLHAVDCNLDVYEQAKENEKERQHVRLDGTIKGGLTHIITQIKTFRIAGWIRPSNA